ncbi:MAG TPA: hypothetical protein VD902_08515, partial [Symbiobacteriaceae bacterium]|nr:hypothetical protein [Symbiobacteriaceae bacterium]
TAAPFFLPVQSGDVLEPATLRRMLRAPPHAVAVTADTLQVTHQGGLRPVLAASFHSRSDLLANRRLPTPILFATAALRRAGGWRPGEACWARRAWRHRPLLARLLAQGPVLAVRRPLGTAAMARPFAEPGRQSLYGVLDGLMLHRVALFGPALHAEGRVAALTPALLTLAAGDGALMLIPLAQITAVSPLPEEPGPVWP